MTQKFSPLTADQIEVIQQIDTPTIANVLEPLNIRPWTEGFTKPEIRCMFPEFGTRVGYAVTVTMTAAEPGEGIPRDRYWESILNTPAPRIVVIQDNDYPDSVGSFWGEVQANICLGLDCVGAVTNGGVRDLPVVRELGFQFHAKDVLVSHAYVRVESLDIPVTVGGLEIRPGDLLATDVHGVIQIPHEIAPRLPELAAEAARAEAVMIEAARSKNVTVETLKDAAARMQQIRKGDIH